MTGFSEELRKQLDTPGGEVCFRKWSKVVVGLDGGRALWDFILLSYLESKC